MPCYFRIKIISHFLQKSLHFLNFSNFQCHLLSTKQCGRKSFSLAQENWNLASSTDSLCNLETISVLFLFSGEATLPTSARGQQTMARGEKGGGINWEIGIDIYTLRYIKQITSKDLLYSTGNSTQYTVMAYMEKNLKKSGYRYMYN